MNDPHVASLTFRVVTSEDCEFSSAPPLKIDTPDFAGKLASSVLTLELKQHVATEAEARDLAAAFIRSWEIEAGLTLCRPDFKFNYNGASIVDRAPSPGVHDVHI